MNETLKVVDIDNEPLDTNAEYEKAKKIYEDAINEYTQGIYDFNDKLFELPGGKNTGTFLLNFLKTEAEWTYVESQMLVKCVERLLDEIQQIDLGQKENIALKSMELEAVNYFFSKVNRKGLEDAMKYYEYIQMVIEALKPTEEFKQSLEKGKQRIQVLEFKMMSWQQGLAPAAEVDLALQ